MDLINALLAFLSIQVRENIVRVGQNSEMADMDNPQGYIYGSVYFLVATASLLDDRNNQKDGLQWAHSHSFKDRQAAENLAWKVEQLLEAAKDPSKGHLRFLDASHWQEIEPQYGSEAWLQWNAEHPETWND